MGAYVNEADANESDLQHAFWGGGIMGGCWTLRGGLIRIMCYGVVRVWVMRGGRW